MWFFKSNSYLGVDLGAGGVKVVELKKIKNRPVLNTYGYTSSSHDVHQLLTKNELSAADLIDSGKKSGSLSVDGGAFSIDKAKIDSYAKIIKAVCKQAKTSSKVAVASLPVSAVFHALVNLPPLKKEEFNRVLKAEVKKLLPYPLEEMVLDYQVLPAGPNDKNQQVAVNAVPRALVVFYTQLFKAVGLQLDSLEPESVALSRSLVGRDNAVTMLVDIGAERTNFFIIDRAYPITHHSAELGGEKINKILEKVLGVEPSLVEQMKRDLFTHLITNPAAAVPGKEDFRKMFNNIIDPILKELEFSLDMFLRQSGNENKRPEKIVLTGGGALFPYLTDYVTEKFNIRSFVGDPWGRVVFPESLRPVLRDIAPRMSVAIGLALRNVL